MPSSPKRASTASPGATNPPIRGGSRSHPGVRAIDVVVDGETVLAAGQPTRVDAGEIRAHAAEQAGRLFSKLSEG